MRSLLVLCLGLAAAACASDDGGGGGGGTGEDTLPKRGELASDPTIVSAAARCSSCGFTDCLGSDPMNSHVRVRIDASDPMGASNLGSCAGTLGSITDQDTYGDGNSGGCAVYFQTPCTPGGSITVGLTVANDTGGVTTASVKLTVAPE